MDRSIFLQNLDSYLITPIIKVIKEDNKLINRTVLLTPLKANEILICERIREKIQHYSNYFYIFRSYDQIALHSGHLNKNTFDPPIFGVAPVPQNQQMTLLTYDEILFVPLDNYLATLIKKKNTKYLFLSTYQSFLHLLQGINKLVENEICYFTISSQSIYFQKKRDLPILGYWENTIDIRELIMKTEKNNTDEENSRVIHFISIHIEKIQDFTNQPLEVFVLFYFIKNKNLTTISSSITDEIIQYYIKHCVVLKFFSPKYKNNYKESCIILLQKYINWNKNDIILDLIKSVYTWDLFSLSYLYLYIIGNFYKVHRKTACDNNQFSQLLHNWISILAININPNFSKRGSILKTLEHCKNLTTYVDINMHLNCSNTNIQELLDIFE